MRLIVLNKNPAEPGPRSAVFSTQTIPAGQLSAHLLQLTLSKMYRPRVPLPMHHLPEPSLQTQASHPLFQSLPLQACAAAKPTEKLSDTLWQKKKKKANLSPHCQRPATCLALEIPWGPAVRLHGGRGMGLHGQWGAGLSKLTQHKAQRCTCRASIKSWPFLPAAP